MGIGASWVINKANSSYELPIVKPVPKFSFYNQDGELFCEKNLEDKNLKIEEFKKSKIAQDFQKNFPDAKFVDLEEKD